MRSTSTVLALAIVLLLNLTACGGGSSGDNTRSSQVTPWRTNSTAEDLLDHWNQPASLREAMSLTAVDPAALPDRRRTLEAMLRVAESDPMVTGPLLRNVQAEDIEIIGERNGITYGRWTGGPAGTLNIEFDWRFAPDLDAAARARVERAGKAWSYRLEDDFEPRTITAGTTIQHDPGIPGSESRTVTFDEDVPVEDALIVVLYSGTASQFSSGGVMRAGNTEEDYEPWLGSIVLSRRHVDRFDVMAHEIGHVIGFADLSYGYIRTARDYIDYENHTFTGPESQRVNGGEPVPFQWVNDANSHVLPETPDAMPDYAHLGVCDSIMAYCRNRREVPGPTELDFAFLDDIGYDVLDARTAAEPELYGYGAWGRYSAWGAGVERILDAPGGDRDTLRAGADAFGIPPSADFADTHRALEGDATWSGALLGVDLGRPMLPPVAGDAELRVDLSSLVGTARFDDLTVLVDGATHAFRAPWIEYPVTVTGNTFEDEAGRIEGGFFGPAHEEMAGVVDDRAPEVDLLAGFGGTR